MSVRILNTRYALRKQAGVGEYFKGFGEKAAAFTKEHPHITRGLALGIPSALAIGLAAKLLGSDNAALWGLLGGSAVGGLYGGASKYFNANPKETPAWLKHLLTRDNKEKRALDRMQDRIDAGEVNVAPVKANQTPEDAANDYSNYIASTKNPANLFTPWWLRFTAASEATAGKR